jgi:hypothetical protein
LMGVSPRQCGDAVACQQCRRIQLQPATGIEPSCSASCYARPEWWELWHMTSTCWTGAGFLCFL